MVMFPQVRVGESVRHEALAVFPLFAVGDSSVDYLLSDEALAAGTVTVEEVSEGGSVPELRVDNRAGSLVLFLEGEELRGAKQNRVLNASLLVAPASRTTIPVSCVERGRWHYRSRQFGSSGSHSSSKLRHVLKKSVYQAVQAGLGHRSDQGEVWKEVGRQSAALGSHSATGAMADTYDAYQGRLAEFQQPLRYIEGAVGLAAAVNGKVVSVDLFDRPATCSKLWARLLTGMVLDAVEIGASGTTAAEPLTPTVEDVQTVLASLQDAPWQAAPAVGAGEELRAELAGDRHASLLVYNGTVVHGSLVLAG